MVCHNEDTSILYHHGTSRISKKAFQQAKMNITDNHEGKMEILPMSSRRWRVWINKASVYRALQTFRSLDYANIMQSLQKIWTTFKCRLGSGLFAYVGQEDKIISMKIGFVHKNMLRGNPRTEKCNQLQKSSLIWKDALRNTKKYDIIGLKNATSCKNLP